MRVWALLASLLPTLVLSWRPLLFPQPAIRKGGGCSRSYEMPLRSTRFTPSDLVIPMMTAGRDVSQPPVVAPPPPVGKDPQELLRILRGALETTIQQRSHEEEGEGLSAETLQTNLTQLVGANDPGWETSEAEGVLSITDRRDGQSRR
jgi:hypothetical protein